MDKRQISLYMKKVFPVAQKLVHNLNFRLSVLFDIPRYIYSRATRRPYFGPLMLAAQTWPVRQPHMRKAIQNLIKERGMGDIRILEIGSWAGSSAILWGTELIHSGCPGKVFCIDPWAPISNVFQAGENTAKLQMDTVEEFEMYRVAQRDRIFPLFWHNVKSTGFTDLVIPIRCKSGEILPYLKPESFDLVFVDGSHAYSNFLNDLVLCAPLVKQSGFMCGDDLELQSDEVDLCFSEKYREKDFVTDPKTQLDYHPGICLGMVHFFKRRVSSYDGFWILKKDERHWVDVSLYQNK